MHSHFHSECRKQYFIIIVQIKLNVWPKGFEIDLKYNMLMYADTLSGCLYLVVLHIGVSTHISLGWCEHALCEPAPCEHAPWEHAPCEHALPHDGGRHCGPRCMVSASWENRSFCEVFSSVQRFPSVAQPATGRILVSDVNRYLTPAP